MRIKGEQKIGAYSSLIFLKTEITTCLFDGNDPYFKGESALIKEKKENCWTSKYINIQIK